MLGINNYNLFPTESFNVVKQFDFKGINVTNPYKKEAYKYCNELDESAKITEVVNTIIRKNNKLIGYNTDYFGFSMLLEYNNIEVNNKNIVIIGNGATANTITKVLYSKGASNIVYLVRNLRDNNEYSLDDYLKFKDYEIIINATPYGTFPNNQMNPLFNLDEFINLKAVIDVVYNPKRTPLLLSAKENVKKISGLYMLVAQAAMAASLYSGIDKLGLINEVYRNLCNELTNIVLIGMPYSGKSKLARELSQATNLKLVDLDLVMKAKNVDLESILKEGTVEDFRALEKEYALNYAKEVKQIISTGGGIVLSKKAMTALKQNGVIVFLDVPLAVLKSRIDDTRPLIRSEEDLIKLYNERIDLYKKYADITIESTDNIDLILEKIYEHINH